MKPRHKSVVLLLLMLVHLIQALVLRQAPGCVPVIALANHHASPAATLIYFTCALFGMNQLTMCLSLVFALACLCRARERQSHALHMMAWAVHGASHRCVCVCVCVCVSHRFTSYLM